MDMMVAPLGKDPVLSYECKNKHSRKIKFLASNQNTLNVDKGKELSTDKPEKPKSRWTGRKVVDAFTVTAYAAIIATAIAAKKIRRPLIKEAEEKEAASKIKKLKTEALLYKANIDIGKHEKGSWLYRCFNVLGKWSEESKELTNNIVYGFGTLAIMPLVILFSPIGKKDASKEDRFFTVLRQPISFATVFAAQLTFEKLFKTLATNLNDFALLDGVTLKNGKKPYFSNKAMLKDLQDTFQNGKNITEFSFNEEALANYPEAQEILSEHIEGGDKVHEDKRGKKFDIKIEPKGNKFKLEEFSERIVEIINSMGEKPVVNKEVIDTETGKVKIDPKTGKKMTETVKYFEKLQGLVAHYEKDYPTLFEKLENMSYGAVRSNALKETSAVIANSVISQALGIMMLNFVYGKMMKKVSKARQSKEQNQAAVNGGSK